MATSKSASRWLECVCVVTFDLELGQALESVVCAHDDVEDELERGGREAGLRHRLSSSEASDLCYSSFPDSNSAVMGDTHFHFRIKRSEQTRSTDSLKVWDAFNSVAPKAIAVSSEALYGYVYFRQVRDSSIRRGYYQKSVVLLSPLPLLRLFSLCVSLLADRFFAQGAEALRRFVDDVAMWPDPLTNSSLQLNVLDHVVELELPSKDRSAVFPVCESANIISSTSSSFHTMTRLPLLATGDLDVFICLHSTLTKVHLLWELVLINEPLLVLADGPDEVAVAVQALVSLVHPLVYAGDFRPFYTIHNSDFKDVAHRNNNDDEDGKGEKNLPALILGATNPFFLKALSHWPHHLNLSHKSSKNGLTGKTSSSNLNSPTNNPRPCSPRNKSTWRGSSSSSCLKSSWKTSYLRPDKNLLSQVNKGVQLQRPSEAQSALIRRHFLELTQTFMIPLERYMASLMPLAKNIAPFRTTPPTLAPFCLKDFLDTLKSGMGPQLTSKVKGDWTGLYSLFVQSPNFEAWYSDRRGQMETQLRMLHLQSLADSSIEEWMEGKSEVGTVDMVLSIREKIAQCGNKHIELKEDVKNRLQTHVDTMLNSLSDDLANVLRHNASKKKSEEEET